MMSSFELAALLILSVPYSMLRIFEIKLVPILRADTFDMSAQWICLVCCVEIV